MKAERSAGLSSTTSAIYLTVEDIKQKILDPKSWMAEGFEKEYEKGKMPDKYKDLMEEKDVEALCSLVGDVQEHVGQHAEAD